MTSSLKIIGTASIERMSQNLAVARMMRGSLRALAMITGRLVRSSSRVTPSAGMPASQRLTYESMSRSPPSPTQPRNRLAFSSRR